MNLLEKIDRTLQESTSHLMLGGRVVPDMLVQRGVISPSKAAYSESGSRGKSWAWRVIADVEKAIQRLFLRNVEEATVTASAPARPEHGVVCQLKLTLGWDEVASAIFSQLRGSNKVKVQKGAFNDFLSTMDMQERMANEINQHIDPLKLISDKGAFKKVVSSLEGEVPYSLYDKLLDNSFDIGILSRRVYSSKGGLTLDTELRFTP